MKTLFWSAAVLFAAFFLASCPAPVSQGNPGDVENPLIVIVARDAATFATADRLNLSAILGSVGNATFSWQVNGEGPPAGSTVSGSRLSLPHDLLPRDYRVDALASVPGDSQTRSGSFVIHWNGSSATPPLSPVANSAYFDTVTHTPSFWDGASWQPFYSNLVVTAGPGQDFGTIQQAIDAAFAPGYTIKIAAGTYDGFVDVKKRVALVGTLIGAGGDVAGTVLVNTSVQSDSIHLPLVEGITYGAYRPTVVISASGTAAAPLVLKDLRIGQRANIGYPRPGILFRPGSTADRSASYSYITLDNVQIVGHSYDDSPGSAAASPAPAVNPVTANEWGIAVDGRTSIDHLILSKCLFKDMVYGVIFFDATTGPSAATNIQVTDTLFSGNSVKGFYAEKLSHATFANSSFLDNGSLAHAAYYFAATNAGIDINLKNGTYSELTFTNLTVKRNGLGSYAGAGLTIKGRGSAIDSAYLAYPGILSGVTIRGGSYAGNEVGIRLGEILSSPPFASLGLTYPTGVVIQNAEISANSRAQLLNVVTNLTLANQQTTY